MQTIFLNKKDESTWSKDEIDPEKIIRVDWWHQVRSIYNSSAVCHCHRVGRSLTRSALPLQLCHAWTHYLFVVPWMWLLNSVRSRHITYAGSWTLVNAHEVAVISGMAAAYSLGATYPKELEEDGFALLCFRCYLLLSHGKWYRKGGNREKGKGKSKRE